MQKITKLWKKAIHGGDAKAALQEIAPLLAHEHMHNLQRAFRARFAQLYQEKWGYCRSHVEVDNAIASQQVTNPDATQPEWLIPNPSAPDKMFWMRILFASHADIPLLGKDFIEKVVVVQNTGGKWQVAAKDGQPEYATAEQIAFFNARFPVTTGIDHPNEIAAYMFAAYVRHELFDDAGSQSDALKGNALYRDFIAWCKDHFK